MSFYYLLIMASLFIIVAPIFTNQTNYHKCLITSMALNYFNYNLQESLYRSIFDPHYRTSLRGQMIDDPTSLLDVVPTVQRFDLTYHNYTSHKCCIITITANLITIYESLLIQLSSFQNESLRDYMIEDPANLLVVWIVSTVLDWFDLIYPDQHI